MILHGLSFTLVALLLLTERALAVWLVRHGLHSGFRFPSRPRERRAVERQEPENALGETHARDCECGKSLPQPIPLHHVAITIGQRRVDRGFDLDLIQAPHSDFFCLYPFMTRKALLVTEVTEVLTSR